MTFNIPCLEGHFTLTRGTCADYRALERFHYRPKSPATWAGIWVIHHRPTPHAHPNIHPGHLVAAAVLSYPTVQSNVRTRALSLQHHTPQSRLAWVNKNVRTISRVIVHPQFRSLGLASRLVHTICNQCNTRYVEAFALMGKVHPFFEKGGMKRINHTDEGPSYFLFDRINN